MSSASRLVQSFKNAFHGLAHTFRSEQNFRIQAVLGFVALALALYFSVRIWELMLIILMIGWVMTMELLNTALEYFTDLLKPRLHHYVHAVKDVMAAAVLVSSLGSAIIGLIIFVPYFVKLFE